MKKNTKVIISICVLLPFLFFYLFSVQVEKDYKKIENNSDRWEMIEKINSAKNSQDPYLFDSFTAYVIGVDRMTVGATAERWKHRLILEIIKESNDASEISKAEKLFPRSIPVFEEIQKK